jgi:hypothetical protein
MYDSMASNYIAGHLPAARGAKKSADRNLRSPDRYVEQQKSEVFFDDDPVVIRPEN